MSTQNKEEELRDEWLKADATGDIYETTAIKNHIADWWLSKLSQREATREKELVEAIEKMKDDMKGWELTTARNDALDDVLRFINNK